MFQHLIWRRDGQERVLLFILPLSPVSAGLNQYIQKRSEISFHLISGGVMWVVIYVSGNTISVRSSSFICQSVTV